MFKGYLRIKLTKSSSNVLSIKAHIVQRYEVTLTASKPLARVLLYKHEVKIIPQNKFVWLR